MTDQRILNRRARMGLPAVTGPKMVRGKPIVSARSWRLSGSASQGVKSLASLGHWERIGTGWSRPRGIGLSSLRS